MNLAGLSQESGVPVATIRNFYQVLVDTFVGTWIGPYGRSGRREILSTPRFLFFDLGVRNAAAGVPLSRDSLEDRRRITLRTVGAVGIARKNRVPRPWLSCSVLGALGTARRWTPSSRRLGAISRSR